MSAESGSPHDLALRPLAIVPEEELEHCESCRSIPFSELFDGNVESNPHYDVGLITHAAGNQGACVLCRFFVEAFKIVQDGIKADDSEKVRDANVKIRIHRHWFFNNLRAFIEPWWKVAGVDTKAQTGPTMWLEFMDMSKPPGIRSLSSICLSKETTKAAEADTRLMVPRRRSDEEVVHGKLNLDVVRGWLHRCCDDHFYCRDDDFKFKRRTVKLRLINVHTRTLFTDEDDRAYVALSYVWGTNLKDLYAQFWREGLDNAAPRQLPTKLPPTIEDAIKLAAELGYDNLWVDALCINQLDADELRTQIASMHLVFECASLTIIAMDGHEVESGLAGMSRPRSKQQQPQVTLSFGSLMATNVYEAWLRQSEAAWEKRAWTLQEFLLSRRVLFLHEEYAAYKCETEYIHDIVDIADFDAHAQRMTQGRVAFWENGFSLDLNNKYWRFLHFDCFLANYSCRLLTHEADILSGCLGALNQITSSTGVGFWQGMPRAGLHLALLWKSHHNDAVIRRRPFPSWSWAGWKGRTEYHYCLTDLDTYENQKPEWISDQVASNNFAFDSKGNQLAFEDRAYIHSMGPESDRLCLSTRTARVKAVPVRETFDVIADRVSDELLSIGQRRLQWRLVDEKGDMIPNEVGEVSQFTSPDYTFQLHSETSKRLAELDGMCELVFIELFPCLRDSPKWVDYNWLFAQVGCLITISPSTGETAHGHSHADAGKSRGKEEVIERERIAMCFLSLDSWTALKPTMADVVIV